MAFGYFVLLLGGLIFFHELGHFLVARACGVRVLVFSLGFGPRWTVYRSPKTGTEYCVSLLPLGGYVKMLGDDPDEPLPEADQAHAFSSQALWKRSAIVAAGPFFNLILPIFIFFFLAFGESVYPAQVGLVMPGGPADLGGMKPGDVIVEIEGERVDYWWQLQQHIADAADRPLDVVVDRGGQETSLVITPAAFREVRYAEIGAVDDRAQIRVVQFFIKPILHVAAGSAAERAGLRTWDRVLTLDGKAVAAWYEVEQQLQAKAGQTVRIQALRFAEQPHALAGLRLLAPHEVVDVALAIPTGENPARAAGLDNSELTIREVEEGSPASLAGLQRGDRIVALDGEGQVTWGFFMRRLQQAADAEHTLRYTRDGVESEVVFKPEMRTEKGELNTDVQRVVFGATNYSEYGAPEEIPNAHVWSFAFRSAFTETWDKLVLNVLAVGGLFAGNVPIKDLGGPILIGQLAAKTQEYGWRYFFQIMVMLSINLGLINLLPIPVLDGGHLFLFALEGLRRRPLSQRWRQALMYAGLAFIVVLMVVVFKNDIERSWEDIVGAFR